jgi:hypothetical protein
MGVLDASLREKGARRSAQLVAIGREFVSVSGKAGQASASRNLPT